MFLKITGSQVVAAQLIAKTDGSDITSGTTTVYVTKDGGRQTSVGTATHEGNGCWTSSPAQADTNADHCAFTFVNSTAITATVNIYTTVLADILIAGIKADLAGITGESRRSVLNALRKLLNKWSVSGLLSVQHSWDSIKASDSNLPLMASVRRTSPESAE